MRDFLRGTLGLLLQLVLLITSLVLGVLCILDFIVYRDFWHDFLGWILFTLAFLAFLSIQGVKYWLGRNINFR